MVVFLELVDACVGPEDDSCTSETRPESDMLT